MKTKFTLLAVAAAGLLTAAASLHAEDPIPPTPPVNPPPGAPANPAASTKPEPGPGGQRGNRLEMMKEKLGLTPDQIEKLKPILEKDREQLMALRQDSALSREQKGEKMREILKSSMEQIKPILTPDQVEKWKAEMEKRRAAQSAK